MRDRHKNIALDPMGHLKKMDHIVDDMSREISTRPIHSPPGADVHNMELMEGIGRRTIKLSKSTFDLKKESEKEELDLPNENSEWKLKTRSIQQRAKGWINRFQRDMKNGRVQHSKEDDVHVFLSRSKSFFVVQLASTWQSRAEVGQKPVKPNVDSVRDLKPFVNRWLKSSLCLICFSIAPVGGERVSCGHCPVVVHRSCISSSSLFPDKCCPMKTSGGRGESDFTDLCNSPSVSPRGLEANMENSNMGWSCPFCIHEVKLLNNHRQEKYIQAVASHAEKAAILMLQACVRMYPLRKRYRLMVEAATKVQRFQRSQHVRRAMIRGRLSQKRPVRISIHEVTIYSQHLNQQNFDPRKFGALRDLTLDLAGVNSAVRTFCQFGVQYLPRTLVDKLTPSVSSQAIASLPQHNLTLKATNTELRRTAMFNLLQLSNVMQPYEAACSSFGSRTNETKKSLSFPQNILFLTITVSRFEHGVDQQLYRDDVPLYPSSHTEIQSKLPEYAGHFKVVEQVSTLVEGGHAKNLDSNVKVIKVFPPRSMVVLPACPADVTVFLTVSKVTEWPRACIIGQSELKADNLSIWRQCLCMSQNFSTTSIEEEPQHDSISRLQLFLQPTTADTKASRKTQALPDIKRMDKAVTSKTGHKKKNMFDEGSRKIVGGRILWSFVSTPTKGSQFGYLFFTAQATQGTYKKKSWCVILDGQLMIYSRAAELRPKEVVILKNCYFNVIDKMVFKLYRPKDGQTWHCMCSCDIKRDGWIEAFKDYTLTPTARSGKRLHEAV